MNKGELLDSLAIAIADGNIDSVVTVTKEVIDAGIDPLEAVLKGATRGLDVVGERYQRLDAFLPDLIQAGDAMKACVTALKEYLKPEQLAEIDHGNVVVGTVFGDIHDIGKNLVATMLAAAGFTVHDLGINVPVKRFLEEGEKVEAKVLVLSALLTQTSYYQKQVIDYLKDAGIRSKYYVVVGGAPISPEWASEIGADGYARTAIGASKLVKQLVTEGVPPPLPQPLIINQ